MPYMKSPYAGYDWSGEISPVPQGGQTTTTQTTSHQGAGGQTTTTRTTTHQGPPAGMLQFPPGQSAPGRNTSGQSTPVQTVPPQTDLPAQAAPVQRTPDQLEMPDLPPVPVQPVPPQTEMQGAPVPGTPMSGLAVNQSIGTAPQRISPVVRPSPAPAVLDMRNGLSQEIVESPTTLSEARLGSMKSVLSRNVGNFIVATFLVGTQGTTSWEGVLYDVGNDYLIIYQMSRDRYVVCDIYSLKYIEFYDTHRQEMCENLIRNQGWQNNGWQENN